MKTIVNDLEPCLREMLPNAFEIIRSSELTIHEAVYAVVLEGSRGLRGGFRPDSDIDLSLLIDTETLEKSDDRGALLRNVIDVTLSSWKSPCELDTAAVFDKGGCGLICFKHRFYTELSCMLEHPDCIGIYKTQKGFNGFVPDIGVLMEKVYPILVIWKRSIL